LSPERTGAASPARSSSIAIRRSDAGPPKASLLSTAESLSIRQSIVTSQPKRILSNLSKVEAGEAPGVIAAFLLYFCVFAGYFAVRPVRETVGTIIGAEAVSNLFIVTWISSIALIPLYGTLCGRFRRQTFLPWIYGFVALSLGGCGLVFLGDENNRAVGSFFYVFISVVNLFMVSVFWSFLLEMFDAAQVKRLFGVIAAGGTSGALTGPLITGMVVKQIGNSGVLLMGAALFVAAIVCQRVLLRIWIKGNSRATGRPTQDRPIGGNPFAGIWLVLKSPYLLGIALFVVLLASVNTFLYFEQLELVRKTFKSTAERTRVFSQLDTTVQSLTILCQIFLTGRLAAKWGAGLLLTAVPVAMVAGLLLLHTFHTFAMLAIVIVARRVGEYAFVRPGREMLFSQLDTETKYKAKNFIDVPVYRGGDALVAKVTTAVNAAGYSPALWGTAFAAAWVAMGWWLGRRREHVGAN
jgi:AAA family ATP:ADP antiporter